MTYPTISLGKLCIDKPQYGANAKAITRTSSSQPRYIRITDIDANGQLIPNGVAADVSDTSTYLLREGDLLIAHSGNTVGKSYLHPKGAEPSLFAGYLIRFQLSTKRINPRFAFFFTKSERYNSWLDSKRRVAGQPNINGTEYASLELPLPPLPEQDRIVEILDQADALRQQRRQADALSQRILPALFHEMFGDPNRNEREWPTLPLDEAFDDVSRKGNKIPRSEYLTAGKIPVIDQGQDAIAGYWDEVGDAYRGKLPVTLFGDHTRIFKLLEHPFCIGADGVRLLRPKAMDCHFAFGLLTLLDVPSRGYSRHFKELRSLSYINPPPDLQERFGNALAELRKLTAKAATSAATLETLFQTLLHRAFDGSLTAKWREGHAKEVLQEMKHQAKH